MRSRTVELTLDGKKHKIGDLEIPSFYLNYYQWRNKQAAVWKRANELAEITERHQYIVCHLPEVLPSVSDLRAGERGVL